MYQRLKHYRYRVMRVRARARKGYRFHRLLIHQFAATPAVWFLGIVWPGTAIIVAAIWITAIVKELAE